MNMIPSKFRRLGIVILIGFFSMMFMRGHPAKALEDDDQITLLPTLTEPLCSSGMAVDERTYPTGELWLRAECSGGKPSGVLEMYYPDGTIMSQGQYQNGREEGELLHYDSQGRLRKIRQYKSGRLNGESLVYDDSGVLVWKGSYLNGQLHGDVKTFHADGVLAALKIFSMGRLLTAQYFTEDGQAREPEPFRNMSPDIEDAKTMTEEAASGQKGKTFAPQEDFQDLEKYRPFSQVDILEQELLTTLSVPLLTSSGALQPYAFEIINQTVPLDPQYDSLIALGTYPSINNDGEVVLVGKIRPAGQDDDVYGLALKDGSTTLSACYTGLPYLLSGTVQVNDSDQTMFRDYSYDGLLEFVKRMDDWSVCGGVIVAVGSLTPVWESDYERANEWSTLNNSNGREVCSTEVGTETRLTTLVDPDTTAAGRINSAPLSGLPDLFPMISDLDTTLVRFGGSTDSPLYRFTDEQLDTALLMATSTDFNVIGAMPGFSDDGRLAAFMADHKTQGIGIYISANNGDLCTYPEKVAGLDGSEYGYFGGFTDQARVGVNQVADGGAYEFQLAYMAWDTSGYLGLYTQKVDVTSPSNPVVSDPQLVIKYLDTIDGLPGTINNIKIYDPINTHGELVLWVSTTEGIQAVVKAGAPVLLDPNPDVIDEEGDIFDPGDPPDQGIVDNLAGVSRVALGAVTDGVTKLLLRIPSQEALNFTIESGVLADGTLSTLSGDEQAVMIQDVSPYITSNGRWYVFAEYKVPEIFSEEENTDHSREIRIIVEKASGGEVKTIPVTLERPPVILVPPSHSGKFKGWKGVLEDNGFSVYRADYKDAIDQVTARFDPIKFPQNDMNFPVENLIKHIDGAKGMTRQRGLAISQVDAVSYSSGGLVVRAMEFWPGREYVRSDNLMKGDVRKLIALGAPHLGSELANWALSTVEDACFAAALEQIEQETDPDGHRLDEAAGSFAVDFLESNRGNALMRVHSIVGLSNDCTRSLVSWAAASKLNKALKGLVQEGICPEGTDASDFFTGFDDIFGTTEHDIVVQKNSQTGHFLLWTQFGSVKHDGILRECLTKDYFNSYWMSDVNMDIANRVVELLNASLLLFD